MLTGTQIRVARTLLGLQRSKLAERMGFPTFIVRMAESVDDDSAITLTRARHIQAYLERQGIEFLPKGSEPVA